MCSDDDVLPEFNSSLDLSENVDQFIATYVDDQSPGIAIFIREGDQVLVNQGFGLADITRKSPVHSETPFYLASVSKQITAMTTMLLEERGKLNYQDTILTYIPQGPDSWNGITIQHLLTHRSGIPDYLNDLDWYSPGLTNDDVLQRLIALNELEFKPDTKYEYSNSGYLLLAVITAHISGQPFQTFVRENIFDPLGMSNSLAYDESAPEIRDRAIGYQANGKLNDYELLTMGDGGMFSTTSDMDKWEQSLYTDTLVSLESLQKAFTSYHSDGYGYGWAIGQFKGLLWYSHDGGLNGYRSSISRFPQKEISIIILSNGSFDWIGKLHDEIINHML